MVIKSMSISIKSTLDLIHRETTLESGHQMGLKNKRDLWRQPKRK